MDPKTQQAVPENPINQTYVKPQTAWFKRLIQIGFGILVLIIVLGGLNYFNILPLSSLYPKELGFLPRLEKQQTTVADKNSPYEATKEQKTRYSSYANANLEKTPVPAVDTATDNNLKEFVTEGVLTGYKENSIILTTANGTVDFILDTNPTYYMENNLSSGNDTSFDLSTKEAVVNPSNTGKLMQINYNVSKSLVNQATSVYLLKKSAN